MSDSPAAEGRGSYRGSRGRFDYASLRPRFSWPAGLWVPLVVLGPLVGGLFYWTFYRMWDRWNNSTGYYSHGPLVIPIAVVVAWLIVRRRGLPMHSTRGSRGLALGMLATAVVVHLGSMFGRITFVSGFMILPVISALVLYLGGFPAFRRLWFPIAFLAFMVPLPDITIYAINFHLKMAAAGISTAVVNVAGVPVFRKGSEVFLEGGKSLTVEDVCSGLRSLISLLAFSMLFTYACRLRGYKRFVLFISAVPIAVAANVVRITVLILVAHYWGVALSMPGGWVHDMMGFLVFVFAFCLMFGEEEVLDALPGGRRLATNEHR